jgi:hypothetical protein
MQISASGPSGYSNVQAAQQKNLQARTRVEATSSESAGSESKMQQLADSTLSSTLEAFGRFQSALSAAFSVNENLGRHLQPIL